MLSIQYTPTLKENGINLFHTPSSTSPPFLAPFLFIYSFFFIFSVQIERKLTDKTENNIEQTLTKYHCG